MARIGFNPERTQKESVNFVIPCDFQHAICIGMTDSGKTASLILPALKERIQKGHAIIAYTYKGHEHRKIKYLANSHNRLEDVIEIGKPHGRYINLMSFLELNAIKRVLEILIDGKKSKGIDSYWKLSASRLGEAIVDIMQRIHKLDMLLNSKFGKSLNIRKVTLMEKDEESSIEVKYEYPKDEPSFKVLAEVTKSPKSIKRFFNGLDQIIKNVKKAINANSNVWDYAPEILASLDNNKVFDRDYAKKELSRDFIKKVVTNLLRLEMAIQPYKDFTINVNSTDGSGNNGVLQVLNNAISNISKRAYINTSEVDILSLLNKNAIVIIDIEGLDDDVHGVLLESILGKLASRIRNGEPNPVSVFIDEANRVLLRDVDIHNDTLREANVELILAIQNEDQMSSKFGSTEWQAIRKNFKHNYMIDPNHKVTYNYQKNWLSKPILIDNSLLNEAEYTFNELPQNRKIFEERFNFDGKLPQKFIVSYEIVNFEREMMVEIIDDSYNTIEVEYIGKELKRKIKSTMSELGYLPKIDIPNLR